MKRLIIISSLIASTTVALAQANAVVTDGQQLFAEGVLLGYQVQDSSGTICSNPYVVGKYISCKKTITISGETFTAKSKKKVWVDTNGTLGAMVVIDKNGRKICSDPSVWNEFRGSTSYIVCEK